MQKNKEYVVHLIRHGFSEGNRDHTFSGHTDVRLTEEGKAELEELRQANDYPKADIYAHSGLSRAKDSLATLYPEVKESLELPDFKEIFFGSLEGEPEGAADGEEFFRRWLQDEDLGYGEESFASMKERGGKGTIDLLKRLREEDGQAAVVLCHAIITRCTIEHFHERGIEEFFSSPAMNGRGYSLYFEEDPEHADGFRFVRVEPLFQPAYQPYEFN